MEVAVRAGSGGERDEVHGQAVPVNLLTKIIDSGDRVLVVDVRQHGAFARGHVRDAVHISGTSMQYRRLRSGKLRVADLVRDEERPVFAQAQRECAWLVVYDEASEEVTGPHAGGCLGVFVEAFAREAGAGPAPSPSVGFVRGGFRAVGSAAPQLCIEPAAAKRKGSASLQLPLLFRARSRSPSPAPPSARFRPNCPASEVLPRLFLGTARDAACRETLRRLGVRRVVNATTDLPNTHESGGEIVYMNVPVLDTVGEDIARHFSRASDFISGGLAAGEAVLVHCHAGVSRSATLVVAYLMAHEGLSFDDSLQLVQQKRPMAGPNLDFICSLREYEGQLK